MNLLTKTIVMIAALCLCLFATAQEHDHEDHATRDMHEHHDHQEAESGQAAGAGHGATDGPILTRTQDIDSALAQGVFSKREEVAAIYVDLDTKALNLVLAPGASMSDQTIADLAVQAGYRIPDVRRGDEALGTAT